MRALVAILIAISCAACSKADVSKTSSDLKTAASDIKHDPAVKQLGTDIKVAAKDTGAEIKIGAADAKVGLKKAGADLKDSAQKAKSDINDKSDKAEDKSEKDKSQG